MKKILLASILSLFVPLAAHAKINVVATTPDLAAIAREIGGDLVDVMALARPTEDPHFVDAKPSFIAKLNRADVLIEGGAELETGWVPPLLEGARNAKLGAGAPGRIEIASGIQMLDVPAALDRSKGDIHAAGNPHFMTDPANGKIAAQRIGDGFCQIDPNSCAAYRANLGKFQARIDAGLERWEKMLAPFAGRQVVAFHNTWPYFARRFGLKIDLFLEPKPGIPPTPAHLARVIAKMKAEKINVIIVEPYQNRRTAEAVAAQTGATVLAFAQYPGGIKESEGGYVELIDYLVKALAQALAGNGK
jgi:zinc/manganese transport system substrate-binding protein